MTKSGDYGRRTVTRADLAKALLRRVGLSRTESAHLVEMFIEAVSEAVLRGEPVKITSFGSFVVRSKRARMGRNPLTGVQAPITPRRVLAFRPSRFLKNRVNGITEEVDGAELS